MGVDNQQPVNAQGELQRAFSQQQNQDTNTSVKEDIKTKPQTSAQKKTPAKDDNKDEINFDEMKEWT